MTRKKLLVRKRLALRSLLLAVVLLLLANYLFGIGLLLPTQVVRQSEETTGTGDTDTVTWVREPDIGKTMRIYLTANENALLLTPAYLSFCGWIDGGGQALDCSGQAPLYAGWRRLTWQDTDSVYYIFGRVDQPDIAKLHVGIIYPFQSDETGEVYVERFGVDTEKTAWLERNGKRYFLLRIPASALPVAQLGQDNSFFMAVTAYNEAGEEVACVERIEHTASSMYGIRFP